MRLLLFFDPAITASLFALIMIVAWRLGILASRRSGPEQVLSRFDDGGLALFGLVLAFSFAGAANRYDDRKKLVLNEATAIGDFGGTVAMLAEPDRSQLARELRDYIELRLLYGRTRFDDPAMVTLTKNTRASQNRIGALLERAIRGLNTPSVHVPLINNWSAATTAHDNRLQGNDDHIPGSVVVMLLLFGLFSTYTMGRLADGTREVSALAYVVLVSLVFWVTLDMETPRRGFLRVSQQPMQEIVQQLPSPATR
jgi:hypothetical protein